MKRVSHPLTLIMKIKNPESLHALAALLDPNSKAGAENPITEGKIQQAMDRIGTVHFARFVLRPDQMELMIITEYDNDFDIYISAFTNAIGHIFDQLLEHTEDGWNLIPVKDNKEKFLQYVQSHDASFDQETQKPRDSYSAYPDLKVLDILAMQNSTSAG